MNLVFDIATSAEFWRRIYPTDRAPKPPAPISIDECAYTAEQVFSLAPKWVTSQFLNQLDGRLHVLVLDERLRRHSDLHVAHAWSGPIPEGSFYKLDANALVASPSFMFLMAASLISTAQLIAFGCELCGLYSFDETARRGFRKRTIPLVTIEQLQLFLAGAQGCRGYVKAMAALPHILERSASPMETFDALAFCLPYRLGGYCLEKPLMNYEVPLTPRAARIAKRGKCFADMCYPEIKLDIEHHGKLDHSSPEDEVSDRARVNALKEIGYEVIELTKDQVNDLIAFEYIAQRIAKLIGKRLKREQLGATPARLAFRREVFGWNLSGGRLR